MLNIDTFVFDEFGSASNNIRLKLIAKRYRLPGEADSRTKRDMPVTLLFTHCAGGHKELWEPIIQKLYTLCNVRCGMTSCHIREVWSFDRQNHGDGGVVNDLELKSREQGVPAAEWADAIVDFVRSSYMKDHQIIPIGHSAGATALMLTTRKFNMLIPPYLAMIMVEPTMLTEDEYNSSPKSVQNNMSAYKALLSRRDIWASKEDAGKWLKTRLPWKTWDKRILNIYVDSGFRSVPLDESHRSTGVTMKCNRFQEASGYLDFASHYEAATQYAVISNFFPIHLVFGNNIDFVPQQNRDIMLDSSKGRKPRSVTTINGAGHLVLQEKPDELAKAIHDILQSIIRCHKEKTAKL